MSNPDFNSITVADLEEVSSKRLGKNEFQLVLKVADLLVQIEIEMDVHVDRYVDTRISFGEAGIAGGDLQFDIEGGELKSPFWYADKVEGKAPLPVAFRKMLTRWLEKRIKPLIHVQRCTNGNSVATFDDPPPKIVFLNRKFCFSGQFRDLTREECQQTVEDRGGVVMLKPTRETDFLVVGEIASARWKYGKFGNKIEHAIKMRDKGFEVHIVSERHMLDQIMETEGEI